MDYNKQKQTNKNISLICLEERSTLETTALRGALEYFGYIVSTHFVGSKEVFFELLSGKIPTSDNIILSSHGYKKGFLLSDERVIKPDEFEKQIKWKGKNVLSMGCCTGTKEFTEAFINGGVKTYIASDDYPDGNATLVFVIYFFFLLKKGDSLSIAFKESKQLDKELNSFALYKNTPSS